MPNMRCPKGSTYGRLTHCCSIFYLFLHGCKPVENAGAVIEPARLQISRRNKIAPRLNKFNPQRSTRPAYAGVIHIHTNAHYT